MGPSRARAFGLAAATFAGITLAYTASALLLAGPEAFAHPALHLNAIYAALIAFSVGAWVYERPAGRRDLDALRAVVDASDEEWRVWERIPVARTFSLAAGAGAALGLGIDALGAWLSTGWPGVWPGHLWWMAILATALFAMLVPLALLSTRRARVFYEIGRRVRVDIGDPAALAPFARVGLRGAAYWLFGSSLAAFLLIDADPWQLVVAVTAVTIAIGVAAFALPSRGVHQRLRETKRAELAWTRERIRAAREALARPEGDPTAVAALPALLAWEARVAAATEWPFDASTLFRFALLGLVPIGSWLGGAIVERAVDAWLG